MCLRLEPSVCFLHFFHFFFFTNYPFLPSCQQWTQTICGSTAPSRMQVPIPWVVPLKHRLSATRSVQQMRVTARCHRPYQPSILIELWYYVLMVQATSTFPRLAQLTPPNVLLHRFDSDVGLFLWPRLPCWSNLSEFQHCWVLQSAEERWSIQTARLLSVSHVVRSWNKCLSTDNRQAGIGTYTIPEIEVISYN
jgi:hypothetical protein